MAGRRSIRSRAERFGVLGLSEGPQRALAGPGSPERAGEPLGCTKSVSEHATAALDHWELWFPARLGPWRTKTRAGIRTKHRRLELPPTLNDRLHHHVKAPWVKEWRKAAYFTAKGRNLPRLERARVSAVIYRDRLGVADPDNDIGRLKPLLDGLRDAGALAKDTHKHLSIGPVEERRGDQGILLVVDEIREEV